MVDSTCKHDGDLSVVRTEYYTYNLLRTPDAGYILDWQSGDFEEGGEFEEELRCRKCGRGVGDKLSEITYEEDY